LCAAVHHGGWGCCEDGDIKLMAFISIWKQHE
jgi:hypothetical protein